MKPSVAPRFSKLRQDLGCGTMYSVRPNESAHFYREPILRLCNRAMRAATLPGVGTHNRNKKEVRRP